MGWADHMGEWSLRCCTVIWALNPAVGGTAPAEVYAGDGTQ